MKGPTTPAVPAADHFQLFLGGAMSRTPHSAVFHQRGFQRWTRLAYTFALVHLQGEWILLGTGFPDDVSEIRTRFAANIHPDSQLERDDQLNTLRQLSRVGVEPADIAHIGLSCLGPYNTGHLRSFLQARIHIGRTAWTQFHAPPPGTPIPPRDFMLPPETHRWLLHEGAERLNLLEDEDEMVPGLHVFRTGGHHHGSLAFVIPGEEQSYVYGDTFFTYRSIAENIPPGWVQSTADFHRARQRALDAGHRIIPAFDHEVFEQHPHGIIISS
jgi:glyoxylase-like metal-dependent hydrolase (beta-lactamase superfamily II)